MVSGARRLAARVSSAFSGTIGTVVAILLAVLGVVGTVLTALQLLDLDIDPGSLLLPAALLVLSNVAWQERLGRQKAERERDEAEAALGATPDHATILRAFLHLHDQAPQVLEPFGAVLERLPETVPEGERRYQSWIDRCAAAIELYRPGYALRFRESQMVRDRAPLIVVVKDDDGNDRWIDAGIPDRYRNLVAQSQRVLADIVAAG